MPYSYLQEQHVLNAARSERTRRKCFVSYYSGDRGEVQDFLDKFGDAFIAKTVGVSDDDDFINSDDTDYVMGQIRKKYLGDSTVTLLMLGTCTHSRRYIDWELKSSLRRGEKYTPNGLIGITLPTTNGSCHLPERFKANYYSDDQSKSYALYKSYPTSKSTLQDWIDTAFAYRTTRADLIANSATMFKYNRKCQVHDATH